MSAVANAGDRRSWWRQAAAGLVLAALLWKVLSWALWHASFQPDAHACQARGHVGACWGVVSAKGMSLVFGHYPQDALWRPALVLALGVLAWIGLWWASRVPSKPDRRRPAWIGWGPGLSLALVGFACAVWLMGGGLGLPPIDSTHWGGLPLTLLLAVGCYLASWPLALGLALARRAQAAWWRWPATVVIEVVRGVPLVTLLFMAAFILPRITPNPDSLSLLQRAGCALTMFSAVYMAEVLRAGLQAVPWEQQEAAKVLGLGWWGTQRRVVLPQATRAVLPALTGHAIGLLKDSSLVMVIGLHELTGGLSLSLGGDADWRPFYFEAYLFVGLIYGLMCWSLALLGRRLEARWVQAST